MSSLPDMKGKVNCNMRSELGSITKRGEGRWLVRITVGSDPKTGKQVRKSKTVRGTRKQAREVMNAMLAKYAGSPSADMAFGTFLDEIYIPWHDAKYTRRDSTQKFHYAMERVKAELGHYTFEQLTRQRMEKWVLGAPEWVRVKAHSALEKAVLWDHIAKNPLKGLSGTSTRRNDGRLDAEQVRAVLAAFRGNPIEAGVIMQACCGLRQEEALGLDWRDIDFDEGTAPIVRGFHYRKGEGWFEETKNGSSNGIVRIPDKALARLREIRDAGGITRTGAIMTSVQDFRRMRPDSYRYYWTRTARPLLGGSYVPVENLRHSHASILIDSGASVEEVKERLRHSSTRVTERHYIKPAGKLDSDAAARFDSVV